MNFEDFKDQVIEGVQEGLYEKGFNVSAASRSVEKMNDSYEALTITPNDSNVGMNINLTQLYKMYEDGMSMDKIIGRTVENAIRHLDNIPVVDVWQRL